MFNAENAQNIGKEISRLYTVMEDAGSYTSEECAACETLYNKMVALSVDLAAKKCTEEAVVIRDIVTNGFGSEADAFNDFEKAAFRLVGNTDKFRNYCCYQIIKRELDMIADAFEIE
jgi:hypothetical protein